MVNNEFLSNNTEKKWRAASVLVLTGAIALAGCSGSKKPNHAAPSVSRNSAPHDDLKLVFDDLGGGSSIIKVYPGVKNTELDKQANGTYKDGESVIAECKIEGRTVHSDPKVGEAQRSSDLWVDIETPVPDKQYATIVYTENSEALLRQLPNCPAVQ